MMRVYVRSVYVSADDSKEEWNGPKLYAKFYARLRMYT